MKLAAGPGLPLAHLGEQYFGVRTPRQFDQLRPQVLLKRPPGKRGTRCQRFMGVIGKIANRN